MTHLFFLVAVTVLVLAFVGSLITIFFVLNSSRKNRHSYRGYDNSGDYSVGFGETRDSPHSHGDSSHGGFHGGGGSCDGGGAGGDFGGGGGHH